MYQIVFLKEIAQVFTYVFLWYFTETRKHRNRSVVVLIIRTAISFENRGTFFTLHAAGKVLVDRERFSSFDSDGNIAGAAILSNLALMLSSPVALRVEIESSSSTILLCVIIGRSNDSVVCL